SDELARLRTKLELVTEDRRKAGEKNAALNARLQELEEALRTTQAQIKDGQTQKLADSGEYKKLWEDAKETNLQLERRIAELETELGTVRQENAIERLRTKALTTIGEADACSPQQLLKLLEAEYDLRDTNGTPVVISGGIEVPLAEHLARLRAPDSGWDYHFRATGARGMGSAAAVPTSPAVPNPYLQSPPNLAEIQRLYQEDRALHDRYRAEASQR
ncbi:MAG: hypothetical protein ACO3DQ_08445, partial [Cephaloticoccus sp.]